ncbi:MAG: HAD family hydrolase, partial [Lautropia sp.]
MVSNSAVPSSFDAMPADALREMQIHPGTVLVDLDETLYLSNSTEDFIGSAWPNALAFILCKVLELVRPWRLTGGTLTRDVWRVGIILLLMPWSLAVWRRAARRLGRNAANGRLVATLNECRQSKAIVTLGFRPIVEPLLAAMGLSDTRLLAMRIGSFCDRREGKRARVAKALGEHRVRDALVITDSLDDRDLLEACQRPLRVIWPEARFHEAFQDVYVPGLYINRVKRPNLRFIYRSIISDELSVWVLASLMVATQPLLHVAGLALLSLSFWAIYECGYVDNDRIGARYERDPRLSAEFFERPVRFPTVLPWVWAGACGVAALLLLRWPSVPTAADLLIWAGILVFTFLWFRAYNRLDKQTRIWFFAGLQMLRSMSFVAIVSVTPIGAAALVSHAFARWVPYYAYRTTGLKYNDDLVGTTRLLFFILISGCLGAVIGWQPGWMPVGFALLAWFVFKARRELIRIVRGA